MAWSYDAGQQKGSGSFMAWSYDANGNVASITDHTSAGRQTRSMTYDNRDRLLTVASPLVPGGCDVRLRRAGQPDPGDGGRPPKRGRVHFHKAPFFIRPLSHPGPIDKVHAMLRENVPDPIVYHCAMTIEIIPFSKIESSASAIDFSHHLPESVLRADLEIVTFFDPGALDWAEFLNALGSSLPERSKRFIYVPGPTTFGGGPSQDYCR
jgi:hypothetical protein